MAGRGGAGRGQGRKPKKTLPFIAASIARQVLDSLNDPKFRHTQCEGPEANAYRCLLCRWREFVNSTTEEMRFRAMCRLEDRDMGRPMQQQEDKIIFDPNQPLRVEIEHIGRPQNQAAAKAK